MDFSGYGCVNCRKMEGAVFDTDEVSSLLGDNFVVIELMVDDKRPLEMPFTVEENGKTLTISTIGEKWAICSVINSVPTVNPTIWLLTTTATPCQAHIRMTRMWTNSQPSSPTLWTNTKINDNQRRNDRKNRVLAAAGQMMTAARTALKPKDPISLK